MNGEINLTCWVLIENISWFGQRAHLNDDNAVIQVMNKFNTLVAIEVLVESRGV